LDLTRGRSRRERARERRGDEASSRRALVISALRERFYDADVVHEQPSAAAQRERPRGRARRRAAISSAVAARRRPGREPPLRAALRRRHSHVWKRRVRLLRRRVPRPRLRRHRAKRECATSTRSCQHIRSPAIFRRRRCCSKSDKQKKREPRARVAACPPAAADAAAADTARAASPRGIARAKKKYLAGGCKFDRSPQPGNSPAALTQPIPSLPTADGLRCSVSRLTRFPPLQPPRPLPSGSDRCGPLA